MSITRCNRCERSVDTDLENSTTDQSGLAEVCDNCLTEDEILWLDNAIGGRADTLEGYRPPNPVKIQRPASSEKKAKQAAMLANWGVSDPNALNNAKGEA